MAAAEILATGTGAANSADVVVTSDLAVGLKGFGTGAIVEVQLKDNAGAYNSIGALMHGAPSCVISAPGTYRFSRPANSTICGVFSG